MMRKISPLVAVLALAACPMEITGPQSSLEGLPKGLDVSLAVEPNEVRQHERFSVQLRVVNTTSETIRVVTSHGCLAVPNVLRDGERVPFRGSGLACTAAITTHTFAPGQIRSITWDMRAELYADQPGARDGAPAPQGVYRVKAEFDTYVEGGSGPKPAIDNSLRVR